MLFLHRLGCFSSVCIGGERNIVWLNNVLHSENQSVSLTPHSFFSFLLDEDGNDKVGEDVPLRKDEAAAIRLNPAIKRNIVCIACINRLGSIGLEGGRPAKIS